jgi:predicted cupin superfamily sugar epimerase
VTAEPLNLRDVTVPAEAVIAALDLKPHPEGGHYREVWRDAPPGGGRGAGTAILYLLARGEVSHWHRVRDAAEGWHWHAGSALALSLSADGWREERRMLGPDLGGGQSPFALVPAGWWQAARPLGAWALVGCTVSPAFEFSGFEMAPPGWKPGGGFGGVEG